MSSSFIASINFAGKELVIYFGIPAVIMGVIGGFLNVIVFLSLKTFRQSSCAFYLMIMSCFDLGRLFFSAFPYIVRWGFGIDWGIYSLFFCKIRFALFPSYTLVSMSCLCLATIDQYFATCSRPRWQKWCNIKLAYRLTGIFIIIWTLHAIPYFVFYDHIISRVTNTTICQLTNDNLNKYTTYGFYLILLNIFPLITMIFGLMAYHNARSLAHRTIPLVRRELDKQLTVMVLVQVLINFCMFLPFSIQIIFSTINVYQSDPIFLAEQHLAGVVTSNLLILSYMSPFYIYVCVSKRFRQQLTYVLFEMHVKRFRRNQINPDDI